MILLAKKILKYVMFDILRSRFIIIYTLLLLALSIGIIYLGKDVTKAAISLLNVVLLLVPLVSIIFGTIHFYNSQKFIEMLLALPIKRKSIFWAEYFGLSASLALSFFIGTGIPLLVYGASIVALYLIITGIFLSFIFTAFAFLSSVINKDKAKGIGLSLIIWFYLSILYDGLVLMVIYIFSDYPLQKIIFVFTALNPVDLARVMILLKLDISALMGYTGATFQSFFGSAAGSIVSLVLLLVWTVLPTLWALRIFKKKNF